MRVAMLIQGYHPLIGGAERQLFNLAPLLRERGVDVHVLTRRYAGLAPYAEINGVPVHRLPIPGPKPAASLAYTLAALRMLRHLRPDVVHAHELLSPATTAVAARRLLGVPVAVKVLRGGALGDIARIGQKPLGGRRLAALRTQVDAFIVISAEIDAELARLGVPAERRRFIPNGIDTARFAPASPDERRALRRRLGIGRGPVAIFTGRLAPEKRVDQLVAVWPFVRALHPAAELLVLGTGSQEDTLRSNAGEGVRFAGADENVAPWLSAADLFVLPSIAEGLSGALLEALACGLPAVATAVGGAPDVITHGESGWLIPPNDMAALREGVLAVLADPARAARAGTRGRERVLACYSLPSVADRLVELYGELAALSRGNRQPATSNRTAPQRAAVEPLAGESPMQRAAARPPRGAEP